MIEWLDSAEAFFARYEHIAWAVFTGTAFIVTTGFGIYASFYRWFQMKQKKIDEKNAFERTMRDELKLVKTEINDLVKRLHHLDDPQTGRVHMVSNLCKEQIETNKKAWALASFVKGKLEAKN